MSHGPAIPTRLVRADHLEPGDELLNRDGTTTVVTEVWRDDGVWIETSDGSCGYTPTEQTRYRVIVP